MIATKGLPDLQTGGRHSIATGRTRWPELRDSVSPERLAPGARIRRRVGKTPAGATELGGALPGSAAPAPAGPDVPAAAANDAGGRNSDQGMPE